MEMLPLDNQYNFRGNIIPDEWYVRFTNGRGSPDLPLISILSEIVYWYRPKEIRDPLTGEISYVPKFPEDIWQTSYAHFERKFGFNREKIRKVLVKLETMGIITRIFRNVTLRGQEYNNRLFIDLHKDSLQLSESKNQDSSNSYKPLFFSSKKVDASHFLVSPSPHLQGIDKNKEENNKDRSRSTDSGTTERGEVRAQESKSQSRESTSNSCKNSFDAISDKSAKSLKDFYPLTQKDCHQLQSLSKREFSLRVMNEILQDMARRLTDRFFKSRKAFLNYMGKVFTYEKRQPEKVNNDNFRIRNNMTEDEISFETKEQYLTEIENNPEVSPQQRFKKLIAAVLSQDKAYNLLKAYKSINVREGVIILNLDKHMELSKTDEEIILKQVQSTHNRIGFDEADSRFISKLQIFMPTAKEEHLLADNVRKNVETIKKEPEPQISGDIWDTVRSKFIDLVPQGELLDQHWISKLEASIDQNSRKLTLKAPSSFVKDWVSDNYMHHIVRLAGGMGFAVGLGYGNEKPYYSKL
ncbi:MAG: hypothetical protein J0M23_03710 [Rickettsiales bacterium]|nr:hypothetical protein [Rickettsiales bacterium]